MADDDNYEKLMLKKHEFIQDRYNRNVRQVYWTWYLSIVFLGIILVEGPIFDLLLGRNTDSNLFIILLLSGSVYIGLAIATIHFVQNRIILERKLRRLDKELTQGSDTKVYKSPSRDLGVLEDENIKDVKHIYNNKKTTRGWWSTPANKFLNSTSSKPGGEWLINFYTILAVLCIIGALWLGI